MTKCGRFAGFEHRVGFKADRLLQDLIPVGTLCLAIAPSRFEWWLVRQADSFECVLAREADLPLSSDY